MTTDALTQLQVEISRLIQQQFSTFSYLAQRHPLVAPQEIPGLRFTSQKIAPTGPGPEDTDADKSVYPLQPQDAETFEKAQQELADDLVMQTKRVYRLISLLPGIDQDEEQQAEEIRKLAVQVEQMDQQRRTKRKEMRQLARRLDAVVAGMSTSIDGARA